MVDGPAGFHISVIRKRRWPNKKEDNMPKLLEPLLAGRKEEDEGSLKPGISRLARHGEANQSEAQVLSHPNLIKSDFSFTYTYLSRFLTTSDNTLETQTTLSIGLNLRTYRLTPWPSVVPTLALQFRVRLRVSVFGIFAMSEHVLTCFNQAVFVM